MRKRRLGALGRAILPPRGKNGNWLSRCEGSAETLPSASKYFGFWWGKRELGPDLRKSLGVTMVGQQTQGAMTVPEESRSSKSSCGADPLCDVDSESYGRLTGMA